MPSNHNANGLQNHSIGETYPFTIKIVADNLRGYVIAYNAITGVDAGLRHSFRWERGERFAGEFESAHRAAEQDCRDALAAERLDAAAVAAGDLALLQDLGIGGHDAAFIVVPDDRLPSVAEILPSVRVAVDAAAADAAFADYDSDDQRHEATLAEFRFLIPILRNPDDPSSVHGRALWQAFEDKLVDKFGGFTSGLIVNGAWRDERGAVIRDQSLPFTVAIPDHADARNELFHLLQDACEAFNQQCIYVSFGNGVAQLIYPA